MMQTSSSISTPIAKTYKDAVVMPFVEHGLDNFMASWNFLRFFGGVYSNGKAVPEALLVRAYETKKNLSYYKPFQVEYQAPYVEPSQELSGDYIFCGPLIPHFGHFIIENLARIWFAKDNPESSLVWTAAKNYLPLHKEILDVLGIKNKAIFVQSPTCFQSLTVPSVGHVFPAYFAPYYFESLGVIEPKPIIPGKKLYLSRSDMTLNGGIANERAMEELLKEQGWKIFHLHKHPVKARFDELSSSEVILSIEGSGFFSFLFFREIRSKIFTISRSDKELFNNDMFFNDVFEMITREKSLDHTRLDIPKKLETGQNSNARFKLDLNIFHDLMEKTDFLSKNTDYIRDFVASHQWNKEESLQLANAALNVVVTDCPAENEHRYKSGLFESEGNLNAAIAELNNAIKIQNNDSQTHARLAQLLLRNGEINSAIQSQKRAMELDEENIPQFHIELSHMYVQANSLEQAIKEAEIAIELDENNPYLPQLYHHLGAILLQKGDLANAEEAQKKAIKLNPEFSESYVQLSYIYAQLGNLDNAIKQIQVAIQLRNNQAHFYYHLGNLLFTKRDLPSAEEAQKAAITLNANYPEAYFQLSHIYDQQGKLHEAMKAVEIAVQLCKNNPDFFYHLGNLWMKLDNLEAAKAAQKKAIALNPNYPEAYFQLSRIYDQKGKLYKAMKKAKMAIQLCKNNPDFFYHLGNLLTKLNNLEAAEVAQNKAIKLRPDFPAALQQLATIQAKKLRKKN